jgi:hypothetical protein
LFEDGDASVGGVVLDADDHGVGGADWFFSGGSCRWSVLGCEGGGDEDE